MLLAAATVAATINGQRLVAEAADARQQKEQLAMQQVQLQGEIASAAATLESTRQSLRETTELFHMATKQAREASKAQFQEMMDAPLGGEIDKFAAVTCFGGGFARGPLMVPFQPMETRLARVADSLLEELAECIAGSAPAVELFSPDRGDDAPVALKAKQRQVVKDRLVSLGVRPNKITLLNEPPPAARIRCLYPCVVIVRRQSD